VNDIIRTVMLN